MPHKYRPIKPSQWATTFECCNCGKTRAFTPDRDMTAARLSETDKTDCPVQVLDCASHIGVSGSTNIFVQAVPGTKLIEARMGISFMGTTQMSLADISRIGSPFHPDWQDNYVQGFGNTQEEAVDNLKVELSKTADLLWA